MFLKYNSRSIYYTTERKSNKKSASEDQIKNQQLVVLKFKSQFGNYYL